MQAFLGHANLATTGRYTGLVDEWAREIAINTPLAVTVEAEKKGPSGHRMLREPLAVNGDSWEFDEAAWHVENVLVWLSAGAIESGRAVKLEDSNRRGVTAAPETVAAR